MWNQEIPTLLFSPKRLMKSELSDLCVVEVKVQKTLVASVYISIGDGMEIWIEYTESVGRQGRYHS